MPSCNPFLVRLIVMLLLQFILQILFLQMFSVAFAVTSINQRISKGVGRKAKNVICIDLSLLSKAIIVWYPLLVNSIWIAKRDICGIPQGHRTTCQETNQITTGFHHELGINGFLCQQQRHSHWEQGHSGLRQCQWNLVLVISSQHKSAQPCNHHPRWRPHPPICSRPRHFLWANPACRQQWIYKLLLEKSVIKSQAVQRISTIGNWFFQSNPSNRLASRPSLA